LSETYCRGSSCLDFTPQAAPTPLFQFDLEEVPNVQHDLSISNVVASPDPTLFREQLPFSPASRGDPEEIPSLELLSHDIRNVKRTLDRMLSDIRDSSVSVGHDSDSDGDSDHSPRSKRRKRLGRWTAFLEMNLMSDYGQEFNIFSLLSEAVDVDISLVVRARLDS